MSIKDLMAKRSKAIADARALITAADAEKRGLTNEENTAYDRLIADSETLSTDIARRQRLETEERGLNASGGTFAGKTDPDGEGDAKRGDPRSTAEYRAAFAKAVMGGVQALNAAELRALQADSDVQGGYLVAPTQMVDTLIKAVDDLVFIRQWATKYQVSNADSLGIPTLTADPADADWTTELATGSEDSTMAFGKRELHPHPLAKRIKISRKLLRKVPNIETLVTQRLGYKFGIAAEKAYLTGSGSGQPLGVFTASVDGISTSRDISSQNTTTALTVEGLINAKYGLKQQYWANAKWLFHRDGIRALSKLRNDSGAGAGTGDFLWKESFRVGEPDTLLGMPVYLSEYVPNTFTTGLYVGILGDFSNYWIADSTALEIQRLVELYAETNQVGLIGRLETDGAPVLEEAFVRVKLA